MFKKIIFLSLIGIWFGIVAYSQSEQLQLTSPVTISPKAAAFAKYGEIPVSLNNGIADISIPLYSIRSGDINFPISLSYHASGVKVEEIASNTGLGWSLSYTGNVTRQVRGKPDESTNGYGNTGAEVENYINGSLNSTQIQTFLLDYRLGNIDGEKDIYYFSLPGSASGKFFLDSNNNYVSVPRSNVKIEQVYINDIPCWQLTNDQGIQYIFSKTETTSTETYSVTSQIGSNNLTSFDGVSAWYLSQIIDAHGNKIEFNYISYGAAYLTHASETKKVVQSYDCPNYSDCNESLTHVWSSNSISGPKIKSIKWRGGEIYFSYLNTNRLDLNTTDTALSEVAILDKDSTLIKKFKFCTSYFYKPLGYFSYDTTLPYRLRLDTLIEIGSTGVQNPPYVFDYNTTLMDDRLSNNQDYWGYYNGKSNDYFVTYYMNVLGVPTRLGADKDIDTVYAQANMLETIHYPTGGSTSFVFENNRRRVYKDAVFYTYNPTAVASLSGNNSGEDDQYVMYFNQGFTVSASDTTYQSQANILARITGQCENPLVICSIQLSIIFSDSSSHTITDGDTLHLSPGYYILRGRIETEFAHEPYASFTANLYLGTIHFPGYYDDLVGGLRIKRIINSDGVKITGTKEYSYNTFGENYSSGSIGYNGNLPEYYHAETDHRRLVISEDVSYDCNCHFNVYSSTSNYPLVTSGGAYVTYANVQSIEKDSLGHINGKTEYYYTTFDDHNDEIYDAFPFPPSCSYEWQRGLLVKQREYKVNNDSSFTLLREKINTYDFLHNNDDTTRRVINGMVAASNEFYDDNMTSEEGKNATLQIAIYHTATEIYNLQSDTTILYDPSGSGDKIFTINSYDYKKYPIVMRSQRTINSKGDTIKITHQYPNDYYNAGFITKMLQSNMVAIPVETYTNRKNTSGQDSIVGGVLTSYKSNSLLRDKVYKLYTSSPFTKAEFETSTMNTDGTLSMDDRYDTLLLFNKYDTCNNIVEQRKKDDLLMTYIWDYASNYPVAEITNADSSSVAYSSFESDGKGNWSFSGSTTTHPSAPTGTKGYSLSGGDITKSGLSSSKTYIVSYWKRDSTSTVSVNSGAGTSLLTRNGWILISHEITGATSVAVSGTAYIDELRLYPKDALITTYTYTPLVGVTSQCDVNNRITYYEYDAFQRLKLIRDQDKNILKSFTYTYKEQQ